MPSLLAIRTLDGVALVVYLAGMVVMGWWFSLRNRSTDDYFLGDRSFPGWAVGLSLLGTSISSITFLAFPANAYGSNWNTLAANLALPLAIVLALAVFIPLLRERTSTSAFEYLGQRYGNWARLYGVACFVIFQLVRLGVVLYLISLALESVLGVSEESRWMVIVGLGVVVAVYTVVGGIGAVIWTDVIQAFVLWGGGFLSLWIIWRALPHGMQDVIEVGRADGKFSFGETRFTLVEDTIWVSLLLGAFNFVGELCTNQNVVQRYLASKSTSEARKATLLYGCVAIPTWVFFFFLGTALYAYHTVVPEAAASSGLPVDQVFPRFIVTQIPAGIAGLVIGGLLAAAMSTVDSALNAVAAVTIADVARPFLLKGRDDRFYLSLAKWISGLTAALMIGVALVLSGMHTSGGLSAASLNEFNWLVGSLLSGCVAGLFLLGMFSSRVSPWAALVGTIVAMAVNVVLVLDHYELLAVALPVGSKWTVVIVNLVFAALAWSLSLGRRAPAERVDGLTVWTRN